MLDRYVKSENERLKSQVSFLLEEKNKLKSKIKILRKRTKLCVGHNQKLFRHNKALKIKFLMQKGIHPKAVDGSKLDFLVEVATNLLWSHEIFEANVVVNEILDDIITNTLSILHSNSFL